MNMCLLEVAMCEKCKSSHFQSEMGSKKFEDWGAGGEYSQTGGVTDLGGVTFAGEVSTPLHAMLVQNISKDLLFLKKFL